MLLKFILEKETRKVWTGFTRLRTSGGLLWTP